MKKLFSYVMALVLAVCMLSSVNVFAAEKSDDLVFDGVSISLSDSIAMNFYVPEDVVYNYDNLQLHLTFEGATQTLEFDEDLYSFTFSDITPDLMASKMTFKLTGEVAGVEYESKQWEYSIKENLYDILALYDVANIQPEQIKICRLVIDLLNYGAGTEKYLNPALEDSALVNAGVSDAWKTWRGETTKEYESVKDSKYVEIKNATAFWKTATLNLIDKVRMKITFETETIEGLHILIQDENKQTIWDAYPKDFVHVDGNRYSYTFSRISPAMFSKRQLFTIYKNDVAVSNTLSYSVDSFIYSKKDGDNAVLSNLVGAIGIYGDSTHKYICQHSNVITHARVADKCLVDGCLKHYECKDCGALFTDSTCTKEALKSELIIVHKGHDWNTAWSSDNNYHYHECKNCNAKTDKEKHVFDNVNDTICNICGATRVIDLPVIPIH